MHRFFKRFTRNKSTKDQFEPTHGVVSILDGVVTIKNPHNLTNNELYATLTIPENEQITVLVNGEKCTERVVLRETDQVELLYSEEILQEATCSYDFSVSDDRMTVQAKKQVMIGKKKKIADVKATQHAVITIHETTYFPSVTPIQEVEDLLSENGYTGILLKENIELLSTSNENVTAEVIKGIQPIEGVAAYYREVFQTKSINFIPKGEVIAILESEVSPIDGADVFGNPLTLALDYTLPTLGKHVKMEQGIITATRDGRLTFDEKIIEIIPQLIIQGDLKEGDGPIIFNDGDVVIEGRILEKSVIRATGAVYANSGIYGATVLSNQGVFVKGNISSSRVYAGYDLLLNIKSQRFLKELYPKIENLQFASVLRYMDNLFSKELFRLFHLFNPYLTDDMKLFCSSLEAAVEMTKRSFASIDKRNLSDFDKENILSCQEAFKDLLQRSEAFELDKPAPITSDNITNSTLYASGVIDVTGDGTYLSFMESAEKVTVKGKVNGGTTIAEKSIEVAEFKSHNTSDYGLIVFDEKGSIRIRKRFPDTTIKVADQKNIAYDMEYNVYYRMNQEK